jgi:hypothetical protein
LEYGSFQPFVPSLSSPLTSSLSNAIADSSIPLLAEPFATADPLFNLSFDPTLAFTSEASSLEYTILSAILGNPAPDGDGINQPPTLSLDALESLDAALEAAAAAAGGISTGTGLDSRVSPEPYAIGLLERPGASSVVSGIAPRLEGSPEPYMEGLHDAVFFAPLTGPDSRRNTIVDGDDSSRGIEAPFTSRAESPVLSLAPSDLDGCRTAADGFLIPVNGGLPTPPLSTQTSPRTADAAPVAAVTAAAASAVTTGASVYDRVTVPYDYTEGYHALMKHLPSR